MGLKERVEKFIEHLDISVGTFENQVGLSGGSVSKMGEGTRSTTLRKITKRYPQLNEKWLKLGEGEMIIPISTDNIDRIDVGDNKIGDNSNYNSSKMYMRALDEISAQRKFTEKVQADLSDTHKMIKDSHEYIMEMSRQIVELTKMVNK